MKRRDFFKLTILSGAGMLLPKTATAQTCYARPAAGMARVSIYELGELIHVADYPVEQKRNNDYYIPLGDVCQRLGRYHINSFAYSIDTDSVQFGGIFHGLLRERDIVTIDIEDFLLTKEPIVKELIDGHNFWTIDNL